MEELKSPEVGLPGVTARMPIQLSLAWGEAAPAATGLQAGPAAASGAPEGTTQEGGSGTDDGRAQRMEAEARRAKMVCVSLLGLLLFSLNYFDA